MRYELTDHEWAAIKPMLPNKPRGVARVNDRRVLNGIFWVLRSGAPWRDLPNGFGPYTTCYNRFVRWRRALGQCTLSAIMPSMIIIAASSHAINLKSRRAKTTLCRIISSSNAIALWTASLSDSRSVHKR